MNAGHGNPVAKNIPVLCMAGRAVDVLRLGNPPVQQLLLRIGIAFPINICLSCLPVSRTLLDVPTFPTTIFSLVNILASFGHRKTLLSLILADGYYDGFKSRHRNEYTDSGASDLLLPKWWEFFWQSERGILTNPTTFCGIILIESCRILCPQVRYFTKRSDAWTSAHGNRFLLQCNAG